MKQGIFTVSSNEHLNKSIMRMTLRGDVSAITAPGQFVNILVDGLFLRRPISVYDRDDESFTIVYKIVGEGTEKMSEMEPGIELDILTGLGNGYDTSLSGDTPLLLGGGVGVPPLFGLARKLISEGKKVTAVLGFNTKDEVFCEDEFRAIGCDVTVTTADGSYGTKGFVTDALPASYSYFYTCGPEPMLRAVYAGTSVSGQFSF